MSDGEELAHQVLRIWWEYNLAHDDLHWTAHKGAEPFFVVDCSDTFDWGEADSEPITADNIDSLEALLVAHRDIDWSQSDWILRLWVCIQRDQPPMSLRMRVAPTWFHREVDLRWPVT
jgi:hypothetical protein